MICRQRVRHTLVGLLLPVLLGLANPVAATAGPAAVSIGSKTFGESYLLAEMAAQLLTSEGFEVERKLGLGGTLIAFQALREGAIDLYPEYTGTVSRVILKQPGLVAGELDVALARQGLQLLAPFGFNNGYALVLTRDTARALSIQSLSDLAGHPQLRLGFSLEFLHREDGWPALKAHYQLPQQASGLEHALAYPALAGDQLDVTDAYTTDGELDAFALTLLRDDRQFFPEYHAALLARQDLPAAVAAVLSRLDSVIDDQTMRALNARLSQGGESPAQVAASFLSERDLLGKSAAPQQAAAVKIAGFDGGRMLHNILVHLKLTGIALGLACLVAIPLALLLSSLPGVARGLLYVTGLVQTIPSLALLALLIPLVGLGQLPAVIALFLYSLLPIVRNTLTGIFGVDPLLKQVATGMGLTPAQRLLRIELPLATPMILAGIKTAAIISIGTATLAAFVGAGGLGEPIITGLTLNDHRLILEGAIPAALLAVAVELAFEGLERLLVPRHLLS